jgi:hypothetical protein
MNIEAVLEELVGWGEDDWIGLWLISAYVAEDLGVEDPQQNLEVTVALVKELLKRGFRAGDSPLQTDGVHFAAWLNQEPDAVVDFIRRQWTRRAELPAWGDCPWFATPRFCRLDA